MKKFLMAFVTAALLMVCLCVPAFAVDADGLLCEHITALDDSDLLIYTEVNNEHYFGCSVCHWSYPFVEGSNLVNPGSVPESLRYHAPDCSICCYSNMNKWCLGLYCSHISDSSLYGCIDGHIFFCPVCDYYRSLDGYDLMSGSSFDHGHVDGCDVCSFFQLEAISTGVSSSEFLASTIPFPSIFSAITEYVTAAIDWLTAIATCIVSTPLLLCFVLVSFVGLGVGLIKRVIHL